MVVIFFLTITFIVFALSLPDASSSQAQAGAAAMALAVPKTAPVFASVDLVAKGAYVLDLKTGTVLFTKNPNVQLSLASLTKVPLALVVAEVLSEQTAVTVPFGVPSNISLAPFQKGDIWRVRDMLDYTLAASSNGGAEILASAANPFLIDRYPQSGESGSEKATLWRMNNLAESLGLAHTYFLNTSGLDLSATQSGAYGSARDMAILFAYAATNNAQLFRSTTEDNAIYTSANGKKIYGANTDEAVGAIPGLIMGKTGFTDLAGGNLAVVFDIAPEHPVVAVVLGSTVDGRFADIKKLVTAAQATVAPEK